MFTNFTERKRQREKKKQRQAAFPTHPDQEWNPQPFGEEEAAPTN